MVKKEFDCPPNQVFDRKPVRRRMARDIYFVFEEGKKKCSKIRGSLKSKSKFGHLNVGEVQKNGKHAKNILYSVKSKRKYFVNANYSVKQRACSQGSQMQFSVSHLPIAKVNPIFVWVKQDDTRIVEVRCEDYDKRNRIRLTKTLNGWRATPRTDPSSSRVVKLIPKTVRKVTLETQSADQKNKDITDLSISKDKYNCSNSNSFRIKNDKTKKRTRKTFHSNEKGSNQSDITLYNSKNSSKFSKNLDYKLPIKIPAESANLPKIDNSVEIKTSLDDLSHTPDTAELQLCPETGLFIPKIREELFKINDIIDLEDTDVLDLKAQADKNQEHETRNLTDLLDESFLLQNYSNTESSGTGLNSFGQNCSNDSSSGSVLINSLVKNSCDNNLMHCYDKEDENINNLSKITKKFLQEGPVSKIISNIRHSITDSTDCSILSDAVEIEGLNVDIFQNEVSECLDVNKAVEIEDLNVDLLQDSVSGCPSLNEDSEIEGLNVDLFHNEVSDCHNFSGPGKKEGLFQSKPFLNINETNVESSKEPQFVTNFPDHKKSCLASKLPLRNFAEESPEDLSYRKMDAMCPFSELRNKYPIMSTNILKSRSNSAHILESNSETITNIFKHYLNSLQTLQTEPVNLEKNNESSSDDFCSNCFDTTFGDIHGEEPIQKRVRSCVNNYECKNKLKIKIKNEPDPLTQLKILIHNSQWKLPDPILVPRECLGAILASPAREIPLLLRTRPELKLPDAFSHPEILKNPNILVISIAQLEAILRVEKESKIRRKEPTNAFTHHFSTGHNEKKNPNAKKIENYDFSNYNDSDSVNCSQVGTCFESDLNNARLAILNKMLLLPYSYGHMSSDVLQLIKEDEMSQKNASNSCFLSLYNQQLPKATMNGVYDKNINVSMNLNLKDHISARLDNPNRKRELLPSIELPMLEELLQSKMHRLQNITKIISEIDENIITTSSKPCLNQKTFAVLTSHKDFKIIKESIMTNNSLSNVRSKCNSADKSFVSSINKNVDLSNITLYKNLRNRQKNIEYKPKLTCKSLSNLTYPENIKHTTVPLVNLITSNDKYFCKYGNNEHENIIQNHIERYSSPISVISKCTHNSVDGVTSEKTDSNSALWHPLFGSNNNNGYSSPWQWTTITSPDE